MKLLIPVLILIGFLGFLAAADIYLSKRYALFFSVEKIRVLYIVFSALIIYMIAAMIIFTNNSSGVASFFYTTAAIITGFMLYLFLATVTIDLLNLIIQMPGILQGIISISAALIISVYGIWNASQIRITERNVELSEINDTLKAVHLSDIHLGHIRAEKYLQRLVNLTNEQNPDLVFITGDLFDGKALLKEEMLHPLKDLIAPVYFVEGNHDIYADVKTVKKYLRNVGVQVLENEIAVFGELQIIGLNHMRADEKSSNIHAQKGNTIKSVLESTDIQEDSPSILLHHSPDGITYAFDKGIDLYLCGHTHGGQLFPANLIVPLVYKYHSGAYQFNEMKIIVSEGTGTWGPPMRVGTKSELIVLNLIKK